MSNEKISSNPLFSPANTVTFSTNALFMPVQENASAILSPEKDIGEVDEFLGQEKENAGTFSLFSKKSESLSDPFASISSPSSRAESTSHMSMQPKVGSSAHHEPQLFVPPPSPPTQNMGSDPPLSNIPVSSPINSFMPPQIDNISNPRSSNPYSRSSVGGNRPRPMFPSSNQFYQPPPATQVQPPPATQVQPPPQFLPVESAPPLTTNVHPPSFERLATGTTQAPPSQAPPPQAPPSMEQFYQPVSAHWFFCKNLDNNKVIWCPFSHEDSNHLEMAFQAEMHGQTVPEGVSTDGGRYDAFVSSRTRRSVYWDEPQSSVRRCTWFCKADNENLFSPYDEKTAEQLEIEYHTVVKQGLWHKGIELPNKETIVIHNPQLIVHYQPDGHGENFGDVHKQRSKVVKRGIAATDFAREIPENEVGVPDHVVFFCHGVGPVCDLRSRSIVECVDDFRSIQLSLLQSHFKNGLDSSKVKRIEFLPIHWHQALHGDATGVDRNIRRLTLPSISRLRHFTNETLLDILFYSSPVYCQTIAETIGNEINSLYNRFLSRNPGFTGKVSLAGHSLGALILFDLLCNQRSNVPSAATVAKSTDIPKPMPVPAEPVIVPATESKEEASEKEPTLEDVLEQLNLNKFLDTFNQEQMDMETLLMCSESDLKDIGLPLGPRKKLIGFAAEHNQREARRKELLAQQQLFMEAANRADATPISDKDFVPVSEEPVDLCTSVLSNAMNVHVDFQQFDSGTGQPAVSYPQLDFKPHALFTLGSPIGMFLTVRGISELGEDFCLPTCSNFINIFHPFDPVAYRVEPLINPDLSLKPVLVPHYKGRKRLHLELKESLGRMGQELKQGIMRSVRLAIGSVQRFAQSHWSQTQENTEAAVEEEVQSMTEQLLQANQEQSNDNEETASATSDPPSDVGFGKLNGGRRIDYVLQERPLESFNDYLFAFQSHLCYWNNEDTVLMLLKEVYGGMGVMSDSQLAKLPQSTPQVLVSGESLLNKS